ncbi:MAG: hypothetical protein JXB47_14600 [Anaerolineae bacterium]|nr:hypothetical protein [Anaerolineae bacterium]
MMMFLLPPDDRDKARLRKRRAIEAARKTQGMMQILWIRLLRRYGFNFTVSYYIAIAIAQFWYVCERVRIAITGAV